jgi:uncharacterized membrane protein
MPSRRYRSGFLAGAAVGAGVAVGTFLLINAIGRARRGRVVRLQKSLQIGRPVHEVFTSWANLEGVADQSSMIRSITRTGNRSHWIVDINSKTFEWDAEIEQFIPNQSIGWKSLNGPKHTGRINFSPLGNDTIVNVTMNYAPPVALARPFVAPFGERIEGYLDQALREFKAAMEGTRQPASHPGITGTERHGALGSARSTGTFGAAPENPGQTQHTRFGGPPSPAEYTRPPESKS